MDRNKSIMDVLSILRTARDYNYPAYQLTDLEIRHLLVEIDDICEENKRLKAIANYVAGRFLTISNIRAIGGWPTVDKVRRVLK